MKKNTLTSAEATTAFVALKSRAAQCDANVRHEGVRASRDPFSLPTHGRYAAREMATAAVVRAAADALGMALDALHAEGVEVSVAAVLLDAIDVARMQSDLEGTQDGLGVVRQALSQR